MQIKTLSIGKITEKHQEVTVIGRIAGNELFDTSGSLLIESDEFEDNDIVILNLLRSKNNTWKIKKIIFRAPSIKEKLESLWRLSSIRADCDHQQWKILHFRHKTIQAIRNYYIKSGYIEIDTPILRLWEDATDNNLFITTIGSRSYPRLHLRSSPEEYTRRAVIPFFKTFEIGKSFRNENCYRSSSGVQTYLPEFTLVEFYEAPADFEDGMTRLEEAITWVLKELGLPDQNEFNGSNINFKTPFKRLKVLKAIELFGGSKGDAFIKSMDNRANDKETLFKELNYIIDNKIKPNLFDPTFLTHFPKKADVFPDMSENDSVLRAELVCGNIEIGEVGTLQKDTKILKNHIKNAIKDRHISKKLVEPLLDNDFLSELERDIPLVGGGGMCIDRLVMILTNSKDIKDVVWYPFPLLC